MIGADTIGTLLDNNWSLGICCRHCPRTIEMKPEAIEKKFGAYRGLRLLDLLPKLTCGQDAGCGSTDMVLFPWKEPAAAAKPTPVKPQSGDLFELAGKVRPHSGNGERPFQGLFWVVAD